MIYATARSQHNLHKLSFIFASDSFYELYRRTKYLQQYTEARRNQVQHIRDTQTQLIEKETLAKKIAEEKLKLLEEKKPEINTLKALKEEKDKLLVSLSKKEKTLKQELKESQNKLNNLDKLVGDLVKEQNTNTATRPTRPRQKKSTVDTKELSQSFTKNKGRMPAPVNKGFIASYFGKQKHPVLKNVMIDNAGIEIQTGSNQGVKAVFEGEVSTIATIPGMGGQVLMLQHGDYFTVYAKIDHLTVKVGDWINKGEEFAEVFTDNKGASILQFQVWKGSKKLNPTDWIRKP
jgi:septal ring factor EnvC (AmiA/AmiB activator)